MGIGFVRDALNNAKRNRDNLKNKSNFIKTHKPKVSNSQLEFKKASKEELDQFRSEFLSKQKKRRRKDIFLFVSIIVSLVALIWMIS